MVKKLVTAAVVVLITAFGFTAMGAQKSPAEKPAAKETKLTGQGAKGRGLAAMDSAAKAKKYLFIFCYKSDDEQTQKMRKLFDVATTKVRKKANSTKVNIADPTEKGIVAKFKLEGAPTPLVLVLAPNGAVTGGFPVSFEEKQLMEAFVSPCAENCLRALQDGKLVLLCVQNASSNSKDAALKGVTDFKADPRFAQFTQIVMLNPTDVAETKFLGQLQVDPKSSEAITVFMTPPGTVLGKFNGATNKARLVTALSTASSGGCGSGSKSSCCPK
ncbi:MAG: hypothetical protein NTX17_10750 [Candidatus Eisenbacteria bacterium]|nr:hypothetical protein [Candidatus Eisenbacteria bacterium]